MQVYLIVEMCYIHSMASNIDKILTRVYGDTQVDKDILEVILDCFCYEMAEELAMAGEVDLPYVGEISLRTKRYITTGTVKKLVKNGGSYAIKFRRAHERSAKRSAKRRNASSSSSGGQTPGGGVLEDDKECGTGTLPEILE
jgi:hypothetical protein